MVDMTPRCLACGELMEWTGDYRTICLEGGEIEIEEEIYACYNPECCDDDDGVSIARESEVG